jgi:hypothetical protein
MNGELVKPNKDEIEQLKALSNKEKTKERETLDLEWLVIEVRQLKKMLAIYFREKERIEDRWRQDMLWQTKELVRLNNEMIRLLNDIRLKK